MKRKRAAKKSRSVMACVEAGDVDGVRKAVADGQGLLDEMEDMSPLAIAIEKGDLKMARALLELGHDPNIGGIMAPIGMAAGDGNMEFLNLLLSRGANVNAPGEEAETALMLAAGAGKVVAVRRLMEAGADLFLCDHSGEDALDYAVRGRRAEIIDLLLPEFPESRQARVKRQSHLWTGVKPAKKLTLAARLEEAIKRPEPENENPLLKAYRSGDKSQFLKLLAEGADPNVTNKEGTTLLGLIAGSSRIVEWLEPLLKAGADPNRGELFRPLSLAATWGAKFVHLLLEAGADPNWTDANGNTALMAAAGSRDPETVQLLLAAGANPNAENNKGRTPYWRALRQQDKQSADILEPLTTDADDARRPWRKNKDGKSPEICFLDAAKAGDIDYVKDALVKGIPVDVADESGNTALHLAADRGSIEMIDFLLNAGAPVEAIGSGDLTALLAAARPGKIEAVRRLLKAGADVHACDDQVLCYACENTDCLELVELLINSGAKVNVIGGFRNSTPLHVATERDQKAVVQRLLEAGADLKARDGNGWTPFLNAALRCRVDTIKLLIDAGSDINAIDFEKRNAFILASNWGKPESAAFLKPLLDHEK